MMIIVAAGTITPMQSLHAQEPISEIIKAAVKKVIKAVDLKIQRLQNETIWLQNAQQAMENTFSKLKLDEINSWVEKQRTLYKDYYEELSKVKSVIAYYQRIKNVTQKQVRLVQEYKKAWNLFRQDKHFSAAELDYIAKVYAGILNESAQNINQILSIIRSSGTQMSDAKRLEIINAAVDNVDGNYYDLVKFNQQNIMLSLQRSKAQNDVDVVKELYGLE